MRKQIRPFQASDLDAVIRLSLRAWKPVFESVKEVFDPELYDYYYPDWRAHQRKDVKKVCEGEECSVWVSIDGETVTGFVAYKLDSEAKSGEIYMVAVDPDYQRQGISTALTDFAVTRMKEAGMEVVMVSTGADPGHGPARRSYEKSGFKPWHSVIYFKKI